MMEKQLPQNIEAEQGVLGSIVIDPLAFDLIADRLTPQDFYRDAHRTIYETIVRLAGQRIMADIITLTDELERINKIDTIGGAGYLSLLVNQVPTSGNVIFYADIVARTAQHRRLIHAAGLIAGLAYAQDENAIDKAGKAIFEAVGQHGDRDFSTLGSLIDEVLGDLDKLHSGEKSMAGVPTGFREIDHFTGGFQRSDLIVGAGRPGMGKTSFMLSVAYNAVFEYNQNVAIFSLEMSKQQLVQRLISYDTHIDLFRLRNGWIEDDEWERLVSTGERLRTDKLQIDATGGIQIEALCNKARRLKASQGVDLIIVDYIQLVHASSGDGNREQQVAEVSRKLKELAKELNVPILALAQLSRAVESRKDKRPQLSDLRESGSIENDADVVLFFYRDEYYDPETLRPGTAEIIFAKHRNGPVGTVDLGFTAKETRFKDLEVSPV